MLHAEQQKLTLRSNQCSRHVLLEKLLAKYCSCTLQAMLLLLVCSSAGVKMQAQACRDPEAQQSTQACSDCEELLAENCICSLQMMLMLLVCPGTGV